MNIILKTTFSSLLFLGITSSLSWGKSEKQNTGNTSPQDQAVTNDFSDRFNKLPEEKRRLYAKLWGEIQLQIQNNNSLGTLNTADKLDKIIDNNPSVYNIKGATYLKLKNTEKSQENFLKACKLDPKNKSFLFNLAETFFVQHEYKKAIILFSKLLSDIDKEEKHNVITQSLIQFKLFLSYVKLGNNKKADEFANLYGIDDDTPFYYCVKGVKEWEKGNKTEAHAAFISALNIYGIDGMYQPFGDSLVETGYMQSVEGPTVPQPSKE